MTPRLFCVSVLLACASLVWGALPLPKYVTPCARSDPNFNECAKKHAQETMAYAGLDEGDRKYKIPALNPFKITAVTVSQGAGLTLKMTDVKIYGLRRVQVEKTNFDFDKKQIDFQFLFPRLTILGKYETDGRIGALPIKGNGDLNITDINNRITFRCDYTLEPKEGKLHMVAKDGKATVNPALVYTNLSNLFNGNQLLGTQMNKFLNENWQEVHNEIGPAFAEVFARAVQDIINNVMSLVPYDVIIPEKLP